MAERSATPSAATVPEAATAPSATTTLSAAVRGYLRLVAARDPRGVTRLWLLAAAAALTEGAGLLLLVPLLALAGVVPGDPGLPVVLAAFVAVAAGRALIVR
ncbi:MAG TPA: hypothetical protein VNV66_07040, partial [Pilimelia sp.]|nr:hypothetical protein [Pilimelia sp.]